MNEIPRKTLTYGDVLPLRSREFDTVDSLTPITAEAADGSAAETVTPPHYSEEEPWSQFIERKKSIEKYKGLFTAQDQTVIESILKSMSDEEMIFDVEEALKTLIKPNWENLSFFGKLFLLQTAENIICEHVFDDPDDSSRTSWAIIAHCETSEPNFFLRSFASNFTNEKHRREAGISRIRKTIEKSWWSSVSYSDENDLLRVPPEAHQGAHKNAWKESDGNLTFDWESYEEELRKSLPTHKPEGGKITIFSTKQHQVWFDRLIENPTDLTDDECRTIYHELVVEDEVFSHLNYHTLETDEWTDVHRDLEFESIHVPKSIYEDYFNRSKRKVNYQEDMRFAVCKVSNDVAALYSADTGETSEYFQGISDAPNNIETSACDLLRKTDGLINSIGTTKSRTVRVYGLTSKEIQSKFAEIIHLLPPDISGQLKTYCEDYDAASTATDPWSGCKYPPTSDEFLNGRYNKLVADLLDWSQSILEAKQIPATPFAKLVSATTDPKQLKEFEFLYNTFTSMRMREGMEQYFGFSYEAIDFRTQLQFILFLVSQPNEYVATVQKFIATYGDNGLRTFLSLERGDETLGDSIVAFGQHDEVASTVFRYYGDLLNSADRAEQLVREVSNCEGDACNELANQVRENILNRAQKRSRKSSAGTRSKRGCFRNRKLCSCCERVRCSTPRSWCGKDRGYLAGKSIGRR